MVDGNPVLALLRGDHELNDIKLKKVLGGTTMRMASAQEIQSTLNCAAGEVGPGRRRNSAIADLSIRHGENLVCGANQTETHYRSESRA